MKTTHFSFVIGLTLLVATTACGVVGAQRLEPGWAAVKIDYANGGARTDIPSGGFLQYNPLTERIAEYPIGQESLVMVRKAGEGQAAAASGDDSVEVRVHGIPLHADTTVFWRIDPLRIGDMFVLRPGVPLIGKSLNDGIDGIVVRRLVRGSMQDAGALFESYADVYSAKRQEYSDSVAKVLGCPTSAVDDPLAKINPLERHADPNTILGREFLICDKLQLGEFYLDDAQQKAVSDNANAITSVLTSAQTKLAAENNAAAAAAPILANAQAEANGISLREKALADSPHVAAYDVAMSQASHPPMVQGGGGTLLTIPAPTATPNASVTVTPAVTPTATP